MDIMLSSSRQMLLLLLGTGLLMVAVPGVQGGGCSCPPLWTGFRNNCYRLFAQSNVTWSGAELICRGFSVPCGEDDSTDVIMGHLTSIHSQEEMDFLSALYDSARSKRVSQDDSWVWIGLHDINNEQQYEWSDGTAVDYTYWNSGQPDTGSTGNSQDCVLFRQFSVFRWHDAGCTSTREYFICKLPKW